MASVKARQQFQISSYLLVTTVSLEIAMQCTKDKPEPLMVKVVVFHQKPENNIIVHMFWNLKSQHQHEIQCQWLQVLAHESHTSVQWDYLQYLSATAIAYLFPA